MVNAESNATVDVAPGVLVWARESIGLPVEPAAKKLGIKPETLVKMEDGEKPVGIKKLREMAKVYDRPLIAFFLPEPPKETVTVPDFRVIHESESSSWSPELNKAYRRIVGQRQIALELAATDDEPIPIVDLRLEMSVDPEKAGERVRNWLNPDGLRKRGEYDGLNLWLGLIESKGVLVTQISDVSIEEMRGFSIGEHPLPVIALNGAEPPRGKLFTLMHELVHILLHRSAMCDLEDSADLTNREGKRLEWYCNSVAAAILMPHFAILEELKYIKPKEAFRWSDDELGYLAGRFGVSNEAMLVRLVTLRLASREFYRERRPAFLKQYREMRKNSKGFLTYYSETIRNLGKSYIGIVHRAYDRGDISDTDLSTYLQVQQKYVPRLFKEAGVAIE